MDAQKTVLSLLLEQLEGNHAHVDFNRAVKGLSHTLAGTQVEGLPHTIWQLIEHIRIAQDDILEFCQNPDYQAPDWPKDYWPESTQPEDQAALEASIQSVRNGIEQMRTLLQDPEYDLRVPLPHGDGQTLFREAMLIVDHNAYHIGQIVLIQRLLGDW